MFEKFKLHIVDAFERLSDERLYEVTGRGRKCGVLVSKSNDLYPIVRTTTIYNSPAHQFLPIHYEIIEEIRKVTGNQDLEFNNALTEIYNDLYRTMRFHSDQALDLQTDSFICLFSCYQNRSKNDRKLMIQSKETKEITEITLEDNSIVIFSTATNRKYKHSIILDSPSGTNWLGVTFRLSKTFIKYCESKSLICNKDGTIIQELKLASNSQKKEFFRLKGVENSNPLLLECTEIDYTISQSDLILPAALNDNI